MVACITYMLNITSKCVFAASNVLTHLLMNEFNHKSHYTVLVAL